MLMFLFVLILLLFGRNSDWESLTMIGVGEWIIELIIMGLILVEILKP